MKIKRDYLVLFFLLLVFGGIYLVSIATQKKGEYAYIQYKNNVLFTINLETGLFEAKDPTTVVFATTSLAILDNELYIDGNLNEALSLGTGIARFENTYVILGNLGYVMIEYKDHQVRVKEETSPYHVCSRQGFSDIKPIICLPNLVSIEFSDLGLDVII